MSTLQNFIEQAWADHAEQTEAVAARLGSVIGQAGADGCAPDQIAALARLMAHVYGDHLARWQDGITLVQRLTALADASGDAGLARQLARQVAALRVGAGDESAVAGLTAPEQVCALAQASAALAAQADWSRSIGLFRRAVAVATAAWGAPAAAGADGAAAVKALAISGNNLAAALEERTDRSLDETLAMLEAAHAALDHWRVAGGWLEEERALYRLARSALQAGYGGTAVSAAQACLEVCCRHAAPAFELFFAHAVSALALRATGNVAGFDVARAAALTAYAQLGADDRPWCTDEMAQIAAVDEAALLPLPAAPG